MKNRLIPDGSLNRKPTTRVASLRQLVALALPYKLQFTAAMAALLVGSAINLLFPEVARRVLDPKVFPIVLDNLPLLTGVLAALFIAQGAAFYFRSYLFGKIGQQVVSDVRQRLFTTIINRDIPFFDLNRSGDLVSRLNSDAALVQDAVSIKLSVILRYGVQVALGVILMTWMSWKMTGAIVISVLSMVTVSSVFIRQLRTASRQYQSSLAQLTSFAAECFGGVRIVRSLGAESEVGREFADVNGSTLESGLRRSRVSAAFSSGASLFLNLLLLLVQWYGIHLVVSSELPLNDLAAFVLYGAIVAVSFAFLVSAYAELMQGMGGLERVFELLSTPINDDSKDFAELAEQTFSSGPTVTFNGVSFSYPGRPETAVLKDLSFSCKGAMTTALVGPSGSGKSSIVQLLLGFYLAQSGDIKIDGTSVGSLQSGVLRDLVAWVPQEPQLFGFSVLQNLMLGNSRVSAARIEELVTEWPFLKFVENLPLGLNTILGENGTQLSGGQRQRVAIARAVLREPRVLILDEATAGLDSETEESVMQVIKSVLPKATVLVISHRLATVRSADEVYVLEDGCIIQQGTHDSLRAAPGLYQQYVGRQALG